MRRKNIILAILVLLVNGQLVFADRTLSGTEITQILRTLTGNTRRTWIPSGTIEAVHLEYRKSRGYAVGSDVIQRYDGERFHWQIDANSNPVEPELLPVLSVQPRRRTPDMEWNKRRVFAWDGARHTMYFKSGNRAVITESPNDVPGIMGGPLNAGIVPWGHGAFAIEQLQAADISAVELTSDAQTLIELTINMFVNDLAIVIVIILDPAKNYAVLSYSQDNGGMAFTQKIYQDYQNASGAWVPTTIAIEQYDNTKQSPELVSYDYWKFTSVSIDPPDADSYEVSYETDARIELHSPVSQEPLSYLHSNSLDCDSLVLDRLEMAADDAMAHNCATVAMRYVSVELGKEVDDSQLSGLLSQPSVGTSLYALRQLARQLRFNCLAVKTDLLSLASLSRCQVILHMPDPNHYVVLDSIDDEYVRIIDLDSSNFYYRTRIDRFNLDWSDGTALLVSNGALPSLTEISDQELRNIVGGATYSCTDLIQPGNIIMCSEMIFGMCGGAYEQFWPRYACEQDEDGGSCYGTDYPGVASAPCIENWEWPGTCGSSDEWRVQYIRACK